MTKDKKRDEQTDTTLLLGATTNPLSVLLPLGKDVNWDVKGDASSLFKYNGHRPLNSFLAAGIMQ